jgi:hypothetical protein
VLTADRPTTPQDLTLDTEDFRVISVQSKILRILFRLVRRQNGEPNQSKDGLSSRFLTRMSRFRISRGLLFAGSNARLPLPSKSKDRGNGNMGLVVSSYAPPLLPLSGKLPETKRPWSLPGCQFQRSLDHAPSVFRPFPIRPQTQIPDSSYSLVRWNHARIYDERLKQTRV